MVRWKAAEPATCWPQGLLGVLEYVAARGGAAEVAQVERAVGFTRATLAARTDRIPIETYYAGVEAAAQALRAPHFGLDYIDAVEPAELETVGFLAAASETVGEAFGKIMRFHRFMTTGDVFTMDRGPTTATFTLTAWGPPRPAHALVTEMYVADTVTLIERMAGAPVTVRGMRLRHRPADPAQFAARVGFAPETWADRNEWTIDADALDAPMPRPDRALSEFLEGLLLPRARPYLDPASTAGTGGHSPGTLDQVRAVIERELHDGPPTVAQTARGLGLSPRTLQRRLADASTTYGELLDMIRRDVAARCARAGRSLEETAMLCGYADLSSFHRARRRWRAGGTAG
ncbi:AraC-like DNA-binding protein [Streptosporangium becharense]|uniref:AraC-like DNA-binding protein n=1 Tax=Streptosporangium becharense TaxID=1816182 RepID=A0A7W9IDS9_9ACTN|nr:AraC family transcriptional regulator [Streptosporangium becharense]MBB2912310.1 AraC-like DNA-binding protein [Streptosporangium becharense]MBB5818857.1 AraC-like DNA-binding protein [Streptosporangium becharense]